MSNLTGQEEVQRNIAAFIEKAIHGAKAGCYQAAQNVMTEAKERCPVDTGALRGSGYVAAPELTGSEVSVEMGFGGPAASYAVRQHEGLELHHPVGEAKFLERAMDNQRQKVGETIAAAVREALGA